MALATYTFASLVQRGFTPNATAATTVAVTVAGQAPITHDVPMMTAGDVVGVAAGQVIRTWPRAGITDAEPNFLAIVEFDAPELPWMFSRPGAGGHVDPWLVLAVIDETELEDPLTHSDAGTKLVVDRAQLPDPKEAWLWAHAQLLDTDQVPDDPARSLSRLVAPRRLHANSRYLACVVPTLASGREAGLGKDPGPLRTSTDWAWDPGAAGVQVELPVYHWYRFATGESGDFEALVRRLHGVPLPPDMGRRRLRLDHPLSRMPAPQGGTVDLELHVALRPPGETTEPIAPLVGQSYLDVLKTRLADAGYDVSMLSGPDGQAVTPHVGPPVYGQLPVGAQATAAALGSTAVPPWLSEVNLDPRARVAAGLGATVVRNNQERYVESAWRQVGDVLAANRLRRRAEYSLAASARIYRRWLKKLGDGDLVTATAPVHAKVMVEAALTVTGRLRTSPLPPAMVSVEFRRLSRARGALSTARVGWRAQTNVQALAAVSASVHPLYRSLPLDSIEALTPPSALWDAPRAERILVSLVPGIDVSSTDSATQLDAMSTAKELTLPPAESIRERLAGTDFDVDRVMSAIGLLPVAAVTEAAGVRPTRARRFRLSPRRHGFELVDVAATRAALAADLGVVARGSAVLSAISADTTLVSMSHGAVQIDAHRMVLAANTGIAATTIDRSAFELAAEGRLSAPAVDVRAFELAPERRLEVSHALSGIAVKLAGLQVHAEDAAPEPGTPLSGGLTSFRGLLLSALDPAVTLVSAVNSRISALAAGLEQHFDDVMAAPDLSEPTYRSLAKISNDWLLPGIDRLPPDTTTLVAANRQFINAFLVGMNHELARELLWREYPTDQRGTYARQFWMRRDTGVRADQFDLLHELHAAPDRTLAGLSTAGTDVADPLVLVVKGDLVKRYPGLIVCAARTTNVGGRPVMDPASVIEPDFVGVLEPDVMLVGFERLTEPGVRAVAGSAQEYWIYFAEHFTEPRFGFDELVVDGHELGPDEHVAWAAPTSWNDAAWQYAALDARGFLTAASFTQRLHKGVDPADTVEHQWGVDAATQAWISLQFPFRRGIRAVTLLPPVEGS